MDEAKGHCSWDRIRDGITHTDLTLKFYNGIDIRDLLFF